MLASLNSPESVGLRYNWHSLMDLSDIQSALQQQGFDAWLFCDHHHRDPIAYRILGLSATSMVTRRWFYVIPAKGEPAKLVHRVEAGHLDSLPGTKQQYAGWQELEENLKTMLAPYKTVAMQYSPNNRVFVISLIDAGTIELIRSFGTNVVSSGDLVARFESTLTDDQIRSHFEARDAVDRVTAAAFQEIGRRVRNGGTHEYEIQQWIMEAFGREGLKTDDPPIVGVNAHSGDPHYEPRPETSKPIREGDWILLDIWGKMNRPDSVYYDITWTGFVGNAPSDRQRQVFEVVTGARDAGIAKVISTIGAGKQIAGWEVDRATRDYIISKGFGEYFIHRTGHSISTDIHSNGANMDDLEVHDVRQILPNSCFSIEPGVYLPEFGVRSEINILVRQGSAEVTGKIQREIVMV
jgi:Xaa-Pro dipeptidase